MRRPTERDTAQQLPAKNYLDTPVYRPYRTAAVTVFYVIAFHFLDLAAFQYQSRYGISFWYAPAGLSMAVMMRYGIGFAPVYFLVSLVDAHLVWTMNPPLGLLEGIFLTIPPVGIYTVSAWLLRKKLRVDFRFEQLRSMVIFSALILCSSALLAVTYISFLYMGGRLKSDVALHTVRDFWIGDVIAHLSFVPFLLTVIFPWTSSVIHFFRRPDLGKRIAPALRRLLPLALTTILWFLFVGVVIWYSFILDADRKAPIVYPCFLPLIWAAFWRGTKGAATGVVSVCGAVAMMAPNAVGLHEPEDLQLFLMAVSVTSLFLGAALTDRKHVADDLEHLHDFYRQAISAAKAVPYVRDYDSDYFAYIGEGIEVITGFRQNEFTPALWEERSRVTKIAGEAAGLSAEEAIRRTRSGDFKTWSSEGKFLSKDGRMRYFSDASVELIGPEGRPLRSIGLIQDISNFKEAELALRESEQQQALILSTLPVCFYSGYLDGDHYHATWVNDTVELITGFQKNEFEGKSDLWRTRIHPDDVEHVRNDLDLIVENGSAASEFRWRHADGTYRWIWNQLVFVASETGNRSQVVGFWLDITERKRAEEAIKASRAVLFSFVEHCPAAVAMLDRNLRYIVFSRRWIQDYKLADQDIVGKSHYDVFPEIRKNAEWQDIHRRCLAGEIIARDEDRMSRADGSEEWLRWEVRPWYDGEGNIGGIIMFTEVITDRKLAIEAIRRGEERLDLALRGAHLGLWDLDVPTSRLTINPEWLIQLKYDPQTVSADLSWWTERFSEGDLDRVVRAVRDHIEGKLPFFDIEFCTTSLVGEQHWIHTRGRVIEWGANGVPVRIMGTLLDVTARKKADEERKQLETQVQHAQKLESLGVLAGGIAHDFNNLLVGILGNADLALVDLPKDFPSYESVQAIVTSAQRAADLCRQMLAYSGRGRFVIMPVNVNELVQEMTQLLSVSVSKRVSMLYDLASDVSVVEADATQLRQIIMNLLTNASEAIGDTEGAIRLSTGELSWSRGEHKEHMFGSELVDGKRYVYLRITDTGCGMEFATIQRIFDPFFTTKFTGRGLGMAAVLGIVRGHGGAITVESTPRLGATFTVLLPAGATTAKARTTVTRHEPPVLAAGIGTVLVVDDEDPVLHIARHMLERKGYKALTARDGHEALEVFARHKDEILLAIVDLTMPRMSGAQLMRELQELKPAIRIVLSSGYNEQEAVAQTRGVVTNFIQKPYRAAEFYAAIQSALNGDAKDGAHAET